MRRRLWVLLLPLLFCASTLWAAAPPDLRPEYKEITLKQMLIWGGAWFMIPLGALSVAALALVIFYFITLRRNSIISPVYVGRAKKLIQDGNLAELEAYSRGAPDVASRVMTVAARACLDNPSISHDILREMTEAEGAHQATDLSQRISYLSDIAVISPMIGLLGTVVGMIKSFAVLAFDVGSTRPLMLAEGVSQALITTAVGLIIAIPAMAFYSYFRGRVQKLVSDLESTTTDLVGRMRASKI